MNTIATEFISVDEIMKNLDSSLNGLGTNNSVKKNRKIFGANNIKLTDSVAVKRNGSLNHVSSSGIVVGDVV